MFLVTLVLLTVLPFQWAQSLGSLGTVPIFRLGALLLILWWGIRLLLPQPLSLPPRRLFLPVFAWMGVVTLSLLVQPELSGLWERKYIFLSGLFPLVGVWYALAEERRYITLLSALLFGAAASALLGIGLFFTQFIVGVERIFHLMTETLLPFFLGERLGSQVALFPSLLVNIGGETWLRVTTFFPDPHVAAFFFGMSACLAWGMYQMEGQRRWLMVALLLVVADLLTFSRGGYVGLMAAGIVFGLARIRAPRSWSLARMALIGLLPIGVWLLAPVGERFLSSFFLSDTSSIERLVLWQTAWEVWQRHFWFGVGLGQYAELIHPFIGDTLPYYAHNLFLDIAVETGFFGLLSFLWLIGLALSRALTFAFRDSGLHLGIVAALTLYLTHSVFETALFSLHVTTLLLFIITLSFCHTPKATIVYNTNNHPS